MAGRARAATGIKDLTVVADRGYFKSEEVLQCHEAGITTFVPKPLTSGKNADGYFGKQGFIYIAKDDEYLCPAQQRLNWRFTDIEHGRRCIAIRARPVLAAPSENNAHQASRLAG
jgi:hypothetical protein